VLKDLGPEVETVVYRILGKESKPHFITDMDFPDLKDLPHGPILSSNGENVTALAIYNGQRGVLVKGPVTAFFADKK
jgi:hypothetical protein